MVIGGDWYGKQAWKWWGGWVFTNTRLGGGVNLGKKPETKSLWLSYGHAMCNSNGQWWCEVALGKIDSTMMLYVMSSLSVQSLPDLVDQMRWAITTLMSE